MSRKKLLNRLIWYVMATSIITMPILLIKLNTNNQNKKNTVRYMYQNTDWKKMAKVEGDYTSFMYDVINQLSSKSTRTSMTKETRIKYTIANFRLATAFSELGMGYYGATIIGLLETDLNPHAGKDVHIMGEVNMFGHCYETARYYYYLGSTLIPTKLWRLVRFEFNKKMDLKDPINALKMTYIWLWIEDYNYDNVEMWTISGYRWGRFVYKHWHDGTKLYPIKFTIKTRFGIWERDPRAYYYTWRKIKTCLEAGDIDGSKTILNGWRKKRDKLKYEEIEYRSAVKYIKALEKKIHEYEQVEIIRKKVYNEMKGQIKITKKGLGRIGGEARKLGWTKRIFNKVRSTCKAFVEALKKEEKKKK